MSENMSIEEVENLITENNKKISVLKEKIEQTKKDKVKKLQDVTNLISEITNTRQIYYDYRGILGNATLFGLTDSEYKSINEMMPLYKQKIKLLDDELKKYKF